MFPKINKNVLSYKVNKCKPYIYIVSLFWNRQHSYISYLKRKWKVKLIEVAAFFRVDKGSVSGQISIRTYVVWIPA